MGKISLPCLSCQHVHEEVSGSGGKAPLILNCDSRWMGMACLHGLTTVTLRKQLSQHANFICMKQSRRNGT